MYLDENRWRIRKEIPMDDENNIGSVTAVPQADAEVKTPTTKKQRSPRRQKITGKLARAASEVTAVKAPTAKRRRYSQMERLEKLQLIETQVSEGTRMLKDAIKSAGIPKQTYYQWKRAIGSADQRGEKAFPTDDELADLVQLKQENQRLRKILAEKLRAENAELRKLIGFN